MIQLDYQSGGKVLTGGMLGEGTARELEQIPEEDDEARIRRSQMSMGKSRADRKSLEGPSSIKTPGAKSQDINKSQELAAQKSQEALKTP